MTVIELHSRRSVTMIKGMNEMAADLVSVASPGESKWEMPCLPGAGPMGLARVGLRSVAVLQLGSRQRFVVSTKGLLNF